MITYVLKGYNIKKKYTDKISTLLIMAHWLYQYSATLVSSFSYLNANFIDILKNFVNIYKLDRLDRYIKVSKTIKIV